MCGINGYIKLNKLLCSPNEMNKIVHRMNDQIVHRGPDYEGLFSDEVCALGMRRLSIIDLGSGMQPIWNEDHTMMIVFNGEIYNYRELRDRLILNGHRFSTQSDTEVIIHGYEEWGTDVAKHLEGMFAFCIYDTVKKQWILVRDRFGEKPLYYYRNESAFIFGSELKSLVSTGLIEKNINKKALSIYFRLTYIPAPLTIYKDVYKLMPATTITISNDGSIEERKYWGLSDDLLNDQIEDYETAKKLLRDAVYASVERRMISDVPLGAFLSGGFDSSIITGVMSDLSKEPVHTFTIGFDEKQYDESKLASLVATKHGTNHRVLKLNWDEAFLDLDNVLSNIDEPFADSSLIATYAVSKLAKKHVTVVLTGDAGDELFAGYNKYLGNYYGSKYIGIPQILRQGLIEPFISFAPKNSEFYRKAHKVIKSANMNLIDRMIYFMCLGFKDDEAESLLNSDVRNCLGFIDDQYNLLNHADFQTRNQFVDLNTVLEGDMLAKVDRASMLSSLETRVPLLDYHIVELAYRMPTPFKIDKLDRKIILKDTFRDLLPGELFSAPKRGFGVPIGQWLRKELKDKLLEYSDYDFLLSQGIFEPSFIKSCIEAHIKGKENRYAELWTFFVFQNWFTRYIL